MFSSSTSELSVVRSTQSSWLYTVQYPFVQFIFDEQNKKSNSALALAIHGSHTYCNAVRPVLPCPRCAVRCVYVYSEENTKHFILRLCRLAVVYPRIERYVVPIHVLHHVYHTAHGTRHTHTGNHVIHITAQQRAQSTTQRIAVHTFHLSEASSLWFCFVLDSSTLRFTFEFK